MRLARSFRLTSFLLAGIGVLYLAMEVPTLTGGDANFSLTYIGWLTMSAFVFLAGFIGILNYARPERMGLCFIIGIITFVLVAVNITTAVMADRYPVWLLLFIFLPVSYVFEAYRLKKLGSFVDLE